jgi:hypothetical protein
MIYVFWSSTKTINFFRCLWQIDINLLEVSIMIFVPKLMVFLHQILPS